MAETTEAIRATAGKLGLQMSFKKTEILPIQHQSSKTTPSVPLGNEGIIKVVNQFEYLGAYSSADGSNAMKEINHRIGWKYLSLSVIHRAHSENWTWCRKIGISTLLPRWNFTMPVACRPYYMLPNVGVLQKEMKPDLMPSTCDVSVKSCGLNGLSMSPTNT